MPMISFSSVFASAVILDSNLTISNLTDSKKLSEKNRNFLYEEIKLKAIDYSFATASVEEVDRINILQASLLAMKRAVLQLPEVPQHIFIDGTHKPDVNYPMTCLVKGDEKLNCVSAASILAKHARDEYMIDCDKKYPVYQFAKHKGYPTAQHLGALRKYGPCDEHRRSFGPVSDRVVSKTRIRRS